MRKSKIAYLTPMDFATHDDRRYFEAHPEATHRVRALVPDEFFPLIVADEYTHVLVTQLAPGLRARLPIHS